MANPQEPNSLRSEPVKRKPPLDDDVNNDPLALTLSSSYYRNVRARSIITPPNSQYHHHQQQQQHMHMHTLLQPQTSPSQLPFNRPPLPLFVPQPPPPSIVQLEALPAVAPVPFPARSSSPPPAATDPNDQGQGKDDNNERDKIITIPPPFPWATDRPARVHTFKYLMQNKILTIRGDVQCGSCHRKFEMGFDLRQKFGELCWFIRRRKSTMHERAPEEWKNPVLLTCRHCGQEKSVKPIVGDEKEHSINWLFLLLGQLLGLCTLEHLRYFCMHTRSHRTAAKDRLLYLTYLQLCKQLVPEGNI